MEIFLHQTNQTQVKHPLNNTLLSSILCSASSSLLSLASFWRLPLLSLPKTIPASVRSSTAWTLLQLIIAVRACVSSFWFFWRLWRLKFSCYSVPICHVFAQTQISRLLPLRASNRDAPRQRICRMRAVLLVSSISFLCALAYPSL